MNIVDTQKSHILYVIACGSSSATLTPNVVMQAQLMGWVVCVLATPHGTKFLGIPFLEEITGYPIRAASLIDGIQRRCCGDAITMLTFFLT